MRLFGLTGGIGMGKSTCADLLRRAGVPVIDTDHLAHELSQPGTQALTEIVAAFGSSILDASGRLDRALLAQIVFRDAAARQCLEGILHPKIRAVWNAEVDRWRVAHLPVGLVVIPLLFETHAEACFDATVCVACSRETQMRRLAARGWSAEQTAQRVAAQMPVEQKLERADFVIWNDGTPEVLAEQAWRIFKA